MTKIEKIHPAHSNSYNLSSLKQLKYDLINLVHVQKPLLSDI